MNSTLLRRLAAVGALALTSYLGYYQWLHPNRVVQKYPWYPFLGPVVVLLAALTFEGVLWAFNRHGGTVKQAPTAPSGAQDERSDGNGSGPAGGAD